MVLGLGNPGDDYAGTRHNVGFRIVEALAARHAITSWRPRWSSRVAVVRLWGQETALALPQTYMNRSGEALAQALEEWPDLDLTRDLVVVYDDLDLACGQVRLRGSGGSGGHRGMESLIDVVGSGDFPRLRFGVGRPESEGRDAVEFVLGPFSESDLDGLSERIGLAASALDHFLEAGLTAAMNRFNGPDPQEKPPAGR